MAERGERGRFLSFVEISALFAVFAGATYLLGVVALVVPIATYYTHDFPTAWYAVSVVPNIALAGQGVSQLLGTLITMLLALALPVVIRMLTHGLSEDRSDKSLKVAYGLSVILVFAFIGLLLKVFISAEPDIRRIVPGDIYVFLVSAVLAVLLPPKWLGLQFRQGNLMPQIASKNRLFMVVALLLILYFASRLLYLVVKPPELPRVEVKTTGTTSTMQGALVTHADGFWYLFNPKGALLAIPDDEIRSVRLPAQSN